MFESFLDEIEKIAASKCRSSTRPIKVDTLNNRQRVDKTRSQLKTASTGTLAADIATKYWKPATTAVGTVAAWETGKQGIQDWKTGRSYRKAMERRR